MDTSYGGPGRGLKSSADKGDLDPAFADWLHQRLAAEREAMVLQLQRHLARELTDHHTVLRKDLEASMTVARVGGSASAEQEVHSSWRERGSPGVQVSGSGALGDLQKMVVRESTQKKSENKAPTEAPHPHHLGVPVPPVAKLVEHRVEDAIHHVSEATHAPLPPVPNTCAGKIVHNWVFETVTSCLIVLNTIVMVAEVQYVGSQIGHDLGHSRYGVSPNKVVPGATVAFDVIFSVFLMLFLVEFCIRAAELRIRTLAAGWMWFDGFILSMSFMDILSRFSNASSFDINPSAMRMARLCRMLRVLKFLKAKEGFAALFLLIKSIQASTHALVWSCLLLVFVMLIAGLLINQLLLGYLHDETMSVDERLEVFELFGTWTRMFITMFEFTLGNWAPPQRVLMRNVAEWWGIFVVIYRAVFCFALVNISAAVFNSETSKAAASDDEVAMLNKERAAKHHGRKVEAIFKSLDKSGDGRITWDEFQELVNDSVMKGFLSTLQVDVEDVQELFKLLDDGDGSVFHEEFVHGMKALGGEAKSLNIIMLTKMARTMDAKLDKLMSSAAAT